MIQQVNLSVAVVVMVIIYIDYFNCNSPKCFHLLDKN